MRNRKEPLYRKENKKALNYRGDRGSDYKHDRHTKDMNNFDGTHKSMTQKNRGMDYTPLYKFLLSKVGQKWDDVFSEAVSRLDKQEPIFNMVILDTTQDERTIVRLGENSQYSALTVNEDGILVKIDPEAIPYRPSCKCCTHTFNGKVYNNGTNFLINNYNG